MGIEPTRPAWKAGVLPLNYTRKKTHKKATSVGIKLVGKTGFEPATPWSQAKYSTKLSYFPTLFCCEAPEKYSEYATTLHFTFWGKVACPERFELPAF